MHKHIMMYDGNDCFQSTPNKSLFSSTNFGKLNCKPQFTALSFDIVPRLHVPGILLHGLIQTSVTYSQKRMKSIVLIAELVFVRRTIVLYETLYLGIFLWITFPMTLCHPEVSLQKAEIVERPKIWVSRKDRAS